MLMADSDASAKNVISLLGISKQYGNHQALYPLDLSVQQGEILSLIGHNGAGKTTLLKLLLGLTRPSSGTIGLWSQSPAEYSHMHQSHSLGYLPEAVAFKGNMSGLEILSFYAQLKGVPTKNCYQLLELMALENAARNKLSTYSKGMRQRLGLAQALLGDPELLVLDEPTSGMDPFFRRKFFQILREQKSRGCTIILSSHSLTELEAETDRIALLKQGQLVIQGSVDDLRQRAGLPVSVRLTCNEYKVDELTALLEGRFEYQLRGNHLCEVICSNGEKMELIKKICSQHHDLVSDLDIKRPGLDELFVHFAGQEEAVSASNQELSGWERRT